MCFDINENIDDFINNKAPISAIIFDYYLNFIPLLHEPVQSVVRVHCRDFLHVEAGGEPSEIIAMFSTGMSFKRLMVPFYDFGCHHRTGHLRAEYRGDSSPVASPD